MCLCVVYVSMCLRIYVSMYLFYVSMFLCIYVRSTYVRLGGWVVDVYVDVDVHVHVYNIYIHIDFNYTMYIL